MNRIGRHLVVFASCCVATFCAAQQAPTVTPEAVSAALTQLEPYIRSTLASTKVPGVAVAVIYNDQVLLLRGYGIRKVGDPAQVDPDTVFEIASVSKPLTSTILASLVGEGKISWDDKILDLNPNFQLSNPETTKQITIRDFLSPQRTRHRIRRLARRPRLFPSRHLVPHAVLASAGRFPQVLCV